MDELRLSSNAVCWHCDPNQFEFKTTIELPPLEDTIGQDRALTAIDFGLGIKDSGFNLFILGQPGSGRSSTIKTILTKLAKEQPIPDDWCYVHDFEDDISPQYIRLPAGKGQEFKKDVDHLIERLAENIPKVFAGKEYEKQKNIISSKYKDAQRKLFQELEQEAKKVDFFLKQTPSGIIMAPIKDGEPLSQEEFENLSKREQRQLEEKGGQLQLQISEVMQQIHKLEEEMREKITEMEKKIIHFAMGHLFAGLEEKYQDETRILEHFSNCKRDIINKIEDFRPQKENEYILPGIKNKTEGPSFDRYLVNLLIDNSKLTGAPVIYEANPTYFNLFGRIEHIIQMGSAMTHFQMIKPGALHLANGGYLILDCRQVLLNLFSYEALKRCIRNKEVKIEDMAEQFRLIATLTLKPQPIPLDCKIILIGTPEFYSLLFALDPDFRKFFKVKVDFDQMMKNTVENVQQYALFIGSKCSEENLWHFDPTAVARTVEYSARLIEDQRRLSSCFADITDLIREASYYAGQDSKQTVLGQHVNLAIESRTYRSNKLEERIQEYIEDGTILVDTDSMVIGQINGLSVYQLGDYSFGKPSRVSVRTFLGKEGVVNIEREVKLSGPLHDKGMMILTGFFGERFAQDKPLAFSATICFEQSYGMVDGDSASTTELYGLLSSLSGLPIKQGIAVTGSVNQHGQVQPIGGVNEKIEGFYTLCKARGLTGEQGVIIPQGNRNNLMLKPEVIAAVEQKKFHVWTVEHVDQGIEILTGVSAGELQEDGCWPQNTVNDRVDKRLIEMTETLRRFARENES